MKLFGIGTPKTGTVSLRDYFSSIGLRVLHNHELAQQIIHAMKSGKRHAALDEYDIFFDGPFHEIANQLLAFSSDHHLLYHWRECEDFINSALVHVVDHRVNKLPNSWTNIDTHDLLKTWQKSRIAYERAKHRDSARVHELQTGNTKHWKSFCNKLGFPHRLLPKSHTSKHRLLSIYNAYCSQQNSAEAPVILAVRTSNDWKNRRLSPHTPQAQAVTQFHRDWWNQTFSLSFEQFRHSLACIARENWSRLEGLDSIVNLHTWNHMLFPDAILIPIDDDDWLDPQLIPQIRKSVTTEQIAITWQANRLHCTRQQPYQSHPWGSKSTFNTNGYAILPKYRQMVSPNRLNVSIQHHMKASIDPEQTSMIPGVWGICPQTIGSISILSNMTNLEQFQQTVKQLISSHRKPLQDQTVNYPREYSQLYQALDDLYHSAKL